MMKRFFSIALSFSLALAVFAVPARLVRRQLLLVDGTCVEVTLHGDAHFHWWETSDGRIVEAVEGTDRYAISPFTLDELRRQHLGNEEAEVSPLHAPRRIGSQQTAQLLAIGSPKVPVVLVNFTDSVFAVADTDEGVHAYYDLYCNGTRNGERYTEHGSYGSIRDYFIAQSDSIFQPEFVIIGPVKLNHPEVYYGEGEHYDRRYNQFVKDAITEAMKAYDGDWKDFDNKNKGQVDMVFCIFAGCGEANGGPPSTIWPKDGLVSIKVDGTVFAASACCNENRGIFDNDGHVIGYAPDGIGIMCHELSHALGLPDFYDTSGGMRFGMDIWSLMDYGCYAKNGYQPCGYTAYERDFMGWRSLKTLDATQLQQVVLEPMERGGFGYKLVNDENENEYYILENRQSVNWDQGIAKFGHGMQVTHVDYDASEWNGNKVNADSIHQRMTIIAANNRYIGTSVKTAESADILKTWQGNLYPFEGNDSLTSLSTPAAKVFKGGFMNKDINLIREHDDLTVSFYIGNDFQTKLQQLQATRPKTSNDVVYDLQGRRVALPVNAQRGIYIVNGRKVIR